MGLALVAAVMAATASSAFASGKQGRLRGPVAHAAQSADCTAWAATPDPWSGALNGEGAGHDYAIKSEICVEVDNGGGTELGVFKMAPVHAGQDPALPGIAHVQLTDNGYSMANSWNIDSQTTGAEYDLWAGWINHPYWGTYCAILWIEYPSEGEYNEAEKVCQYTDGY